MTWCQASLSFAFLQAVWTPKFWGWTSSSITLSQVDLGRPGGLRQSGGGCNTAAMTRWWSSSGADRARCPKNLNWNNFIFSETAELPCKQIAKSDEDLLDLYFCDLFWNRDIVHKTTLKHSADTTSLINRDLIGNIWQTKFTTRIVTNTKQEGQLSLRTSRSYCGVWNSTQNIQDGYPRGGNIYGFCLHGQLSLPSLWGR